MNFNTYAISDIGKIREKNEDACMESCFVSSEGKEVLLMVVADGMGGHKAGDVASNEVINVFKDKIENGSFVNSEILLEDSIYQANRKILDISSTEENMKGMGTTCTAMVITDKKSFVAHVGDSRAYLIRKNYITRLTTDHTVAEQMVSNGMMSEKEAETSPKKNILMRALGINPDLKVDIPPPLKIKDGDIFLLCSDGLIEYLSEEELLEISSRDAPDSACRKMVDLANSRGGKDNITVIITKAVSGEKKRVFPEVETKNYKSWKFLPLAKCKRQ